MNRESRRSTKVKRLLIVAGRLGVGGAERFTSNLIKFLDRNLYEIHLCLGIECIQYQLPDDIVVSILDHRSELHTLRTSYRLGKVIEGFQPDIILSTISQCNRWIGSALGGKKKDILWVARIGNNPVQGGRSGWRNRINVLLDRKAYKKADRFVLNSTCLESLFLKAHPAAAGKTVVIYNPTDFPSILEESKKNPIRQKKPGSKVIVHAGRFHRQKRHDLLLESFSLMRKQLVDQPVELWLLGDGYLYEKIKKQITVLNVEDSVFLLGHQQNPYAILKQADVFVLCSDWEGMPNVLVEAMALRVPAVSTTCACGPEELLDDNNLGFLCPPGDKKELAEKMVLALHVKNRTAMVSKAEAHVLKLFDYRTNMASWQQVLS